MIRVLHYLIDDIGTDSSKSAQSNQRTRFANTVALLYLMFLSSIFILLLYQYGYKPAAKLVLVSSLISIIALILNYWGKTSSTNDYKEILSTSSKVYINYNVVNWLVDIRNLGFVAKEDRTWFASATLPKIAKRGCKTMVVVKNETDSKRLCLLVKNA